MRYLMMLALLFCGCGIFNKPPVTEPLPPGVTKEVMQMHNSIVKMQTESAALVPLEMPKPRFTLYWHHVSPPSAGVTEYRMYRAIGADTLQAVQQIGSVPYPDSIYVDSTVVANTRYVYRVTSYAGNRMVLNESIKSNPVTAAWVNLGPLVKDREKIRLRDSVYSIEDLLVVTVPAYHPNDIVWTKKPTENVTWKGEFDVDKNCLVNLTDLSLYAQQVYNKAACDSASVGH